MPHRIKIEVHADQNAAETSQTALEQHGFTVTVQSCLDASWDNRTSVPGTNTAYNIDHSAVWVLIATKP